MADEKHKHGARLLPSRRGTRLISLAALLERTIGAFRDEHGEDSPALRRAVTEAARLKLLLATVDYVAAVESVPLDATDKADLMRRAYAALFGYGPLDALLADSRVTTIALQGVDRVAVRYGHGDLQRLEPLFEDEAHLRQTIRRLLAASGADLREDEPVLEAGLTVAGRRVSLSVAGPPVTLSLSADLRLHPAQPPTLDDLVRAEVLPSAAARWLRRLARSPYGVIVAGEAESGKTTLLGVLAHLLAAEPSALLAVERTGELHLPDGAARLLAHTGGPNTPPVTLAEQVQAALARGPDCLLLDEVRTGEPEIIGSLLAVDHVPRMLWTFRGPASGKRLRAALGLLARRSTPAASAMAVQRLYERLPFVVTLRRRLGRLTLHSIAEWQRRDGADDPDYVELTDFSGPQPIIRDPLRPLESD